MGAWEGEGVGGWEGGRVEGGRREEGEERTTTRTTTTQRTYNTAWRNAHEHLNSFFSRHMHAPTQREQTVKPGETQGSQKGSQHKRASAQNG